MNVGVDAQPKIDVSALETMEDMPLWAAQRTYKQFHLRDGGITILPL